VPVLRRATDWILPEDNPAGVIYGLITIGALLAAESSLGETYPEVVGSLVLAICLHWLAHAYADLLGHRLATNQHLTTGILLRSLRRDWAIVRGATLPLLPIVVAWIADARVETADTIAVWACAASIVVFELLAGVRAKSSRSELALEGCVGASMGLAIVALRAIIH
jgi:hypothetical protein